MRPALRRSLIALALLALVGAGLFAAYRYALHRLQEALTDALGPRASVGAIDVSFARIELRDLRIRGQHEGPARWPAEDELRAERVQVRPDIRSAFKGDWRVGHVSVERAYISLHRSADGKLHVLPSLLERPAAAAPSDSSTDDADAEEAAAAPLVLIDRVSLHDAEVDFYDASVRPRPHRMQLSQLQAEVRNLKLPALDIPIAIQIDAQFKGRQRDGRLKIDGTLTPAKRDARLKASASGVDLVALQPYLLKVAEGGVKRGRLDLTLDASVKNNQLKAPGVVTLADVELGGNGVLAGLPQRAVLSAMARRGRVTVHFTLAGRLDDPNFSLNENIATRVTNSLAETLGVSVGGVVQGMGNVIKGLLGR
ncbi:MAG TPA: DUF748 domain-containing protein [Burkholderiaceae bacterium]|nr:DUF748 domain-containing protein [Burkholderiaceae bacterium]